MSEEGYKATDLQSNLLKDFQSPYLEKLSKDEDDQEEIKDLREAIDDLKR